MHRTAPLLAIVTLALAACAEPPTGATGSAPGARAAAGGGNPSFHSADYVIPGSGGNKYGLVLDFKQTGLGSFSNVDYILSDVSTIVSYRCLNAQETGPDLSAAPYQHGFGSLAAHANIAPRNGQTTATLVLPVNVSSIDRPQGGLHPSVVSISFRGINFTWGAGGVTYQGPIPPEAAMSAPQFDVVVAGQ
ncbi:MAG TPA: hypothetical protein VFJ74_16865 [Gemmatimonadaceae bacterium]|nr:hypothetical protein [Gemmatimonadaceae bacterium]